MKGRLLPALVLDGPALAMVTIVIFVPSLYIAWLSLQDSTFGVAPTFVGLENYRTVLSDPQFWLALRNTVFVVLIVVHVEILIALGMALVFAAGLPFRTLMIAIVLLPYAVSEVTSIVIWKYLFDPSIGLATVALASVGLPGLDWPISPLDGLTLVSVLSIWLHLPFTFMILYAARLAIPADLYEAARIDGASVWQQFRFVTLPGLSAAIIIAMLFRYIFAFRLFSEVWLLTGGGPARQSEVVAVYLYLEAFRYNAFGVASATGWIMVATSLALASVYIVGLVRQTRRA